MWFIAAFIVGHVYMAIREDIMSDDTVISTMVNGYRSHKFPKRSARQGGVMSEPHVIVMGLGNLLWADEGFGDSRRRTPVRPLSLAGIR